MNQIDQLIASLGKEIEKTKQSSEKEEQMVRLRQVAEHYEGEDRVVHSDELMAEAAKKAQERVIPTGYRALDAILKGFIPGQLIVMSAATKSGKTTFCMELTHRMKSENPAWLSFEEGIDELLLKFKEGHQIVPHLYAPLQMKGNTLEWVEKKIVEAKVKYNTSLIFIDHLHFIVPFTSERQDLAIGKAMRELKRMAKEWGVVIVLIAHIKKTRVDRSPTLEDLRDSSFVAQEADTVIMLYRNAFRDGEGDMQVTNEVSVSVLANRRTGKTGNVKMVYDQGKFVEKDWRRGESEVSGWEAPAQDSFDGYVDR